MSSIFNYILISLVAGSAVMGSAVSGPSAFEYDSNPSQSPSSHTIDLPKLSEYVDTNPENIQSATGSDPKCSGASMECETYSFTINPPKKTGVSKPCEKEGNCLTETTPGVEHPVFKEEPIANNQPKEEYNPNVKLGAPCEKDSKECNSVPEKVPGTVENPNVTENHNPNAVVTPNVPEKQISGSVDVPTEPKQNDVSCERGVDCKANIPNGNTYIPNPKKVSNESNPNVSQDDIKSELPCSSLETCPDNLNTAEESKITEPELEKTIFDNSKGTPTQQFKIDGPVQQEKLEDPQTIKTENQVPIHPEEPKLPVKTDEITSPVDPIFPSDNQVISTPHPKQCKSRTKKTINPSYHSTALPKKETNQNETIPETQARDVPELQLQPVDKKENPLATTENPDDKTEKPLTAIEQPVAEIEQHDVNVENPVDKPIEQVDNVENPEVEIKTTDEPEKHVAEFKPNSDYQPISGTQEPFYNDLPDKNSLDVSEKQEKPLSGPETTINSQPIAEDEIKNKINHIADLKPFDKLHPIEKPQEGIESNPKRESNPITESKPDSELKNNVETQKHIAKILPNTEPQQPSNECVNSSECKQSTTEPEKIKENETSKIPEEKSEPKEETKDFVHVSEINSIVTPTTIPSPQSIIQFFVAICKQKIQPLQDKIEQIAVDPHSNTVDKVENSLEKPVESLKNQFKLINGFLNLLYKSQPNEVMPLLEKNVEPENTQGSLPELKDFIKNLLGNVPDSKIAITIQVCLTPIIQELPQIEKKELKSVVNEVVDGAKVKCQQQNNPEAAKELEIAKGKIDAQILKQ